METTEINSKVFILLLENPFKIILTTNWIYLTECIHYLATIINYIKEMHKIYFFVEIRSTKCPRDYELVMKIQSKLQGVVCFLFAFTMTPLQSTIDKTEII